MDDRTEQPASKIPPRVHNLLVAGFVLAIGAILVVHTLQYDFISDDAFITLRYSQNLAEGEGWVFNAGDRVEGFTCPLWSLLLAGIHLLGGNLLIFARFFGVLAGMAVLFFSYKLVIASAKDPVPRVLALCGPLLLACNGSFACWAASGMETMLYLALLAGCFWAVIAGRSVLSFAFLFGLLLSRPEAIPVFLLLGLYLTLRWGHTRWKPIFAWFSVGVVTLAVLFLTRYLYYGEWLPNTYYAKSGGGIDQILRGLTYLQNYASDHEGLVLMGIPVLFALLMGNLAQRCLAVGALGLWTITVYVGGDGLPMYRFSLAPLALLVVLQVHVISEIHRVISKAWTSRWKQYVMVAGLVVLAVLVNATPPKLGFQYGLYHYQKEVEVPRWTRVGKWFRDNASPEESLTAAPIGAVAYYSGLSTYDMLGLTDKHIARKKMDGMGKGWAGHEKHDGQYILNQRPTYLLLGNIDVTDTPRPLKRKPFISPVSPAIWNREKDFYATRLIVTMYEPRSVQIGPGEFLNFYQLKQEYRQRR